MIWDYTPIPTYVDEYLADTYDLWLTAEDESVSEETYDRFVDAYMGQHTAYDSDEAISAHALDMLGDDAPNALPNGYRIVPIVSEWEHDVYAVRFPNTNEWAVFTH